MNITLSKIRPGRLAHLGRLAVLTLLTLLMFGLLAGCGGGEDDAAAAARPLGQAGGHATAQGVRSPAVGPQAGVAASGPTVSAITVAPTLSGQPRDRYVIEGVVATFRATAGGTLPRYSWERSNDGGGSWSVVGSGATYSTAPADPAAAASGGDHGAWFRVTASNAAGSVTSRTAVLSVGPLGQAAEVLVQYPPAGLTLSHTLATASGAGYAATADLAAGRFSAFADGQAPDNHRFAYASARTLRFINLSGAAVTIAAGHLRASFGASYTLRPSGLGTAAAANVALGVTHPGGTAFARANHQAIIGNNGVSSELFVPVETGGGSVLVHTRGMGGISGELQMPAIVLAAGAEMSLTVLAQANATLALSDLETLPLQLTLELPPGVKLDTSAVVPLGAWVH